MSWWEELTAEDRQRLAGFVGEAIERAFPDADAFGSPQMAHSFRALLGHLVQNAAGAGVPMVFGSYDHLFHLVAEAYPAWAEELRKAGRAHPPERLGRKSIKSMVSQWRKAFEARPRSAAIHGTQAVFYLRTDAAGHVWLGAQVPRFRLSDGREVAIPMLTGPDGLPNAVQVWSKSASAAQDALEKSRRQELIARRLRDLGNDQDRAAYRAVLEKKSLADLEEHDREVVAERRRKGTARALAIILLFMAAGFITYRILTRPRLPITFMSSWGQFCLCNVKANDEGLVAYFDKRGNRLTEWVHELRDESGTRVRAARDAKTGIWNLSVVAVNPRFSFTVPENWRTPSADVLPMSYAYHELPGVHEELILWVLIDRRAFPESVLGPRTVSFFIDFGDRETFATPNTTWCLTDDCSRQLLAVTHRYKAEGTYDVYVQYLRSWEGMRPDGKTAVKPDFLPQRLAKVRISKTAAPVILQSGAAPPVKFNFTPLYRHTHHERVTDHLLPQVILVPSKQVDPGWAVLAIIPDLERWPPLGQLSSARYGLRTDRDLWLSASAITVYPLQPNGYAFLVLQPYRPGDHEASFEGTYRGRPLPPARFKFRIREDGTPELLSPIAQKTETQTVALLK